MNVAVVIGALVVLFLIVPSKLDDHERRADTDERRRGVRERAWAEVERVLFLLPDDEVGL